MYTGMTHFTSQAAAAAILDGWLRDLIRGERLDETRGDRMPKGETRRQNMGPPEIKVRLYSRSGTNDPREQRMAGYGTDTTKQKYPKEPQAKFRSTFPDDVFMWCGSKPLTGENGEAVDRLEMWRAYGDDGRGVALTTWWNVENIRMGGLDIVEINYLPDLSEIRSEMRKLLEEQGDLSKSRSDREKIRMKRMKLGACHKHLDYKSEEEVRMVCFLGDESAAVRRDIRLEATSGRLRTYIERPVQVGTTLTGVDITLGPRMRCSDYKHWEKVGQWMLAQMGLSGGSVQQSQLEYIG